MQTNGTFVTNDADDPGIDGRFGDGAISRKANADCASDGIRHVKTAGEMARRFLVDYDDRRTARAIAVFDPTAGFQRNAEGIETRRVDHLDSDEQGLFEGSDTDSRAPSDALERQVECDGCAVYAGRGAKPVHERSVKN